MKVIGLTGPAGSGKSTVAAILRQHHGFVEESFAQPIRDFIHGLIAAETPCSELMRAHKEAPHPLLCGKSPRYAMQTLGTEWGRNLIHPDFWITLLDRDLRDCAEILPRVVISDVRFPNEAAWIRERGELWHLTRPGLPVNSHASEAGIAVTDCDLVLDNDCDLDELAHLIDLHVGAVTR